MPVAWSNGLRELRVDCGCLDMVCSWSRVPSAHRSAGTGVLLGSQAMMDQLRRVKQIVEWVVAMDRCRMCWRASGVQRAAWAGVALWTIRSIMERRVPGVGGVAGACVVGSRLSGEGDGFEELSGWVVVVDGGIVVGSVGSGVGRGGGSSLSVVGLTCGAFLGVACVVLEVGGGGGRRSDRVGGVEGDGGSVVGSCGFVASRGFEWL